MTDVLQRPVPLPSPHQMRPSIFRGIDVPDDRGVTECGRRMDCCLLNEHFTRKRNAVDDKE